MCSSKTVTGIQAQILKYKVLISNQNIKYQNLSRKQQGKNVLKIIDAEQNLHHYCLMKI